MAKNQRAKPRARIQSDGKMTKLPLALKPSTTADTGTSLSDYTNSERGWCSSRSFSSFLSIRPLSVGCTF